jgi:glycosyltransferase involved in cell wall biosynthesis
MKQNKRILIFGNTGLNESNNSTNNRMKSVFYDLSKNHNLQLDYYKLRATTLDADYINYVNEKENKSLFQVIKEIISQNTDYHLSIGETFKGALISYALYLLKGTPFVWRQFGTTFNDEFHTIVYRPKVIFKLLLHKLITKSKGCRAIICTEDGCANKALFIERLGVSVNKFHLIKNQRTPLINQSIPVKENPNDFIITQVGRISPWKKIHLLLKALSFASSKNLNFKNNYSLNIIGITQDESYERELKKYIEDHNMSSQVYFLNNLGLNELSSKLTNSSITVSLTAYNPIIESLQNQTPVITYEYGEINDVFDKCNAVKVICKDIKKSSNLNLKDERRIVEELGKELMNSYNNKNKLIEIGIQGKEYVENNFPTLEEHVKLINQVLIKAIS